MSARPYKIESWSQDELILGRNENYWGDDKPIADQIVMVPREDQATEILALLSGEVDYIYPQFTDTLAAAFEGETGIEAAIQLGSGFEGFYLQDATGDGNAATSDRPSSRVAADLRADLHGALGRASCARSPLAAG